MFEWLYNASTGVLEKVWSGTVIAAVAVKDAAVVTAKTAYAVTKYTAEKIVQGVNLGLHGIKVAIKSVFNFLIDAIKTIFKVVTGTVRDLIMNNIERIRQRPPISEQQRDQINQLLTEITALRNQNEAADEVIQTNDTALRTAGEALRTCRNDLAAANARIIELEQMQAENVENEQRQNEELTTLRAENRVFREVNEGIQNTIRSALGGNASGFFAQNSNDPEPHDYDSDEESNTANVGLGG